MQSNEARQLSQEELLKLTISEELKIISEQNGGFLNPVHVVEFARNPSTALHDHFEWDDSEAAEKYRLWQARAVIRMELTVIQKPEGEKEYPTRLYVSLPSDRRPKDEEHGRGYREIMTVMEDDDLREQLLTEARRDMLIFRRKYNTLRELAKVIAAIGEIV